MYICIHNIVIYINIIYLTWQTLTLYGYILYIVNMLMLKRPPILTLKNVFNIDFEHCDKLLRMLKLHNLTLI